MGRDRDDICGGLDLTATRRRLLQAALGAGGAAGMVGAFPQVAAAVGKAGNFPEHKEWKFVFVNHVTTNPFLVPTQYGIADTCALLGGSYQ